MAPDEQQWHAEDTRVREALLAAGWRSTTHGDAFGIADLEHDNGSMAVHVSHEILKSELLVTMSAEAGKSSVLVDMHGRPDALLATLTAWQPRLDEGNFRDFVEDVVAEYPDTYELTEHTRKRIRSKDTR
ncbi:hypothetical protein [Saccharothrix sp. NRRL B-16314]|uniref:hypothetical protein n=1 Tax=Saccharothrix sp. NRRL B-16314 TaxID=1463825 RepID=UPI000524407F|nr:hypothetical protein [Saccharothrix sp. NRRL B-16314]